jgi:solute carrier family 29 (equilibrative nucleoside transporter) protein 4
MEQTDDPPMSLYGVGVLSLESPGTSAHITSVPALSFSNPVYDLSNPTAGENDPNLALMKANSTLATTTITSSKNSHSISTTVTTTTTNNTDHVDAVGTPTNNTPKAYKVEHILSPPIGPSSLGSFRRLKMGLESRWRVAQTIYPFMACIALAYCITLSLYPGIESEIISCNLGNWMPVLLMFTFNTSDVVGKILAAVPYNWSRRQLVLMSSLRALLIPLLLLCCAPRNNPTIAGEVPAFIFTAALGITNGLSGSLPIMLAPAKVPATLKEITGGIYI